MSFVTGIQRSENTAFKDYMKLLFKNYCVLRFFKV